MNLVNKEVEHKTFGKGKVVEYCNSYIKIDFPSGRKEFVFPDAFDLYLELIDQKAAEIVDDMVQKRKKEYEEEQRELEKQRALKAKKRQRLLKKNRPARRRRARRVHPQSQCVFWCKDEEKDTVFEDWNVFTGVIKSGDRQGEPRRLARISKNTACLLTARAPDISEKDRRIIGVFMVDEAFKNEQNTDGYIPAHLKYRLRLSEQESERMLFWNYYVNERYPHRTTWNTGRHRYFDNIWMAQILKDIISLKENSEDKEFAEQFFEYFCKVNQIDKKEIPEPNGPLMNI